MARFFEGCVFESRQSQYSPALEFVYFFQEIKKRPVNLVRIFLVSSKTVSIQGKIDTVKTQTNEYWKEREPDFLTVLLEIL